MMDYNKKERKITVVIGEEVEMRAIETVGGKIVPIHVGRISCPFCGKRHRHGKPIGWRQRHCVSTGKKIVVVRGGTRIDNDEYFHMDLKDYLRLP